MLGSFLMFFGGNLASNLSNEYSLFCFFVVRQTRLSGEQVRGGGEIKQSHLFNFWDFVSPLHPCIDLHPTVPLLSHPQPSLRSCVQHPLILPSPPRPFISLPSPPLCLSPISLYQRRFSPLRPSLLGNPSAAWNEERERARDREWEKQKERERGRGNWERQGRRKCKGRGRAGQKGLKKERKKDAGSEEAEAERVKDGEVGQVRSDVDSDAAEIRPRAEGGRLTGGDVHRTCKDERSVAVRDFIICFLL